MTDYGEKYRINTKGIWVQYLLTAFLASIRMAQALADSKRVIAQSAEFLLNISTASTVPGAADGVLRVNEQHFVNRLPEQIGSRQGSLLVVANPLGHPREEVVCLQVDNENTRIGRKGMEIRQQIGWNSKGFLYTKLTRRKIQGQFSSRIWKEIWSIFTTNSSSVSLPRFRRWDLSNLTLFNRRTFHIKLK
jgi:hypothetical protein